MWSNDGGFAAEGGSSGAGFMNSPSQFSSPAQGKKDRRTQNAVPVTVKTIHDTQGESIVIGGTEASMVVLVGIIRSVDISSTKTTYVIEDSTGVIEGIQWQDSDSEFDENRKSTLMEMTYCKAVGSLRTQANKKHLLIYNIVPITDANRITTHILEVIHNSMKLQQIQTMKMSDGNGMAANKASSSHDMTQSFQGMAGNAAANNTQGLVGHAKLVYQIIKLNTDETGINRQSIYDSTNGKINPATVDKLLEDLSGEGLIFCSIDDHHFKTSDNY